MKSRIFSTSSVATSLFTLNWTDCRFVGPKWLDSLVTFCLAVSTKWDTSFSTDGSRNNRYTYRWIERFRCIRALLSCSDVALGVRFPYVISLIATWLSNVKFAVSPSVRTVSHPINVCKWTATSARYGFNRPRYTDANRLRKKVSNCWRRACFVLSDSFASLDIPGNPKLQLNEGNGISPILLSILINAVRNSLKSAKYRAGAYHSIPLSISKHQIVNAVRFLSSKNELSMRTHTAFRTPTSGTYKSVASPMARVTCISDDGYAIPLLSLPPPWFDATLPIIPDLDVSPNIKSCTLASSSSNPAYISASTTASRDTLRLLYLRLEPGDDNDNPSLPPPPPPPPRDNLQSWIIGVDGAYDRTLLANL